MKGVVELKNLEKSEDKNPPKNGPSINPVPKAIPIIPKFLDFGFIGFITHIGYRCLSD